MPAYGGQRQRRLRLLQHQFDPAGKAGSGRSTFMGTGKADVRPIEDFNSNRPIGANGRKICRASGGRLAECGPGCSTPIPASQLSGRLLRLTAYLAILQRSVNSVSYTHLTLPTIY